jgi:hypothetical protein
LPPSLFRQDVIGGQDVRLTGGWKPAVLIYMSIGEHIQTAIDCTDRGLFNLGFVSTCAALGETLAKTAGSEIATTDDFRKFLKENWELIAFMSLPKAIPLPLNVPFGIKRIDAKFNVHYGIEEIVLMIIEKTIRSGKLPDDFAFHSGGSFEINDGKLLIPHTLVGGLVGITVVHPDNKNESISNRYWINISDFKMFVSELWGRIDLAVRIRKFYLERD